MSRVTGCIGLEGLPRRLLNAVAEALEVEARHPPDPSRGRVVVKRLGDGLRICFEARDLAAARTLVNAYLSLAAAVADAVTGIGEAHGSEASPRGGDEAR